MSRTLYGQLNLVTLSQAVARGFFPLNSIPSNVFHAKSNSLLPGIQQSCRAAVSPFSWLITAYKEAKQNL